MKKIVVLLEKVGQLSFYEKISLCIGLAGLTIASILGYIQFYQFWVNTHIIN